MAPSAKEACATVFVVLALFASSLWSIVASTAQPAQQVEEQEVGSRVQQLYAEPQQPTFACETRVWNGETLFECEADSWGKWQLSWENPDTAEMYIVLWEAHNKSIGKKLTTNPGEFVVKFWDADGQVVTRTVLVSSTLQPCREYNNCFRV